MALAGRARTLERRVDTARLVVGGPWVMVSSGGCCPRPILSSGLRLPDYIYEITRLPDLPPPIGSALLGLTPKCNTHIITHNQASETSRFELILYIYSFKEWDLNKFDWNLRHLY